MHVTYGFILFIRFLREFGLIKGWNIFLKLKYNRCQSILIPGLEHPIALRPNTSDIDVFIQIFIYHEYRINWKTAFAEILDLGANVGMFALFMHRLHPNAAIYCVEPDEENYQILVANVSKYPTIHTLKKGIWNKTTMLHLHKDVRMGAWGTSIQEEGNEDSIECISISDLMNFYQLGSVGLMKMDIESSEKEVFESNYESWLPQISNIVIELHDRMKTNCAKQFFSAVNQTFDSYEYDCLGENTILKNCTR
jgi:FkbM family methyltransferase